MMLSNTSPAPLQILRWRSWQKRGQGRKVGSCPTTATCMPLYYAKKYSMPETLEILLKHRPTDSSELELFQADSAQSTTTGSPSIDVSASAHEHFVDAPMHCQDFEKTGRPDLDATKDERNSVDSKQQMLLSSDEEN